MKKFFNLIPCVFVVMLGAAGCSENDSGGVVNLRGYHPVKAHLAGADFGKLQSSAAAVLTAHGAKEINRIGDTIVWGTVINAAPQATYDVEIRMRKESDGIWFQVSSADWNDSLAKITNHKFAESVADKLGYVLP